MIKSRIRNGNKIYYYREEKNGKRKEINFSEANSGKFAKKLAELSAIEGKRIEHVIDIKDDYAIMNVYSKKYGYFKVKIDLDDIEKVKYIRWSVSKRLTGKGFYIRNNSVGRLHRYLLNIQDDNLEVDHINRDCLDNRKSNLRPVTKELNMKNISIQKNNKSGITGIRFDGRYWWGQISINGKQKTKSFSINKYGYEEAKQLALTWRKNKEKENDYLGE